MSSKSGTLLFLSGHSDLDLKKMGTVVCFSSARADYLRQQGIEAFRFSDFSFPPSQGQLLDNQLLDKLEILLEQESQSNGVLKWVPLAVQQIRTRLSYYMWLKQCCAQMIRHFNPAKIYLCGHRNEELTYALTKVCVSQGLDLQIQPGHSDLPESTLHLSLTYDIPTQMDPGWFIRLRWWMLSLRIPKGKTLYQWYWNLGQTLSAPEYFVFNHHRVFNFINSAAKKLNHLLTGRSRDYLCRRIFPELSYTKSCLKSSHWDFFQADEQEVIDFTLAEFIRMYPAAYLDQMQTHCDFIFKLIKPRRIILSTDQIGSSRFLSWVAHANNILVDDLVHGIVMEDCCGRRQSPSYYPDRALAWNQGSQHAFESQNWQSVAIAHPRNKLQPQLLQVLGKNWKTTKVLILMSEWLCISLEGRVDAPYLSIMEPYHALLKLGVLPENITVKSHHYSALGHALAKKQLFEKMQRDLGMGFKLYQGQEDSMTLMKSYDMVVMGITSGVYEAVLQGIPIVIFAFSLDRVGAIKPYSLPFGHEREGLYQAFKNYDHNKMTLVYQDIAASLQTGASLEEQYAS